VLVLRNDQLTQNENAMARISIIVPVYNEAECILPYYYELKKHVPPEIELIWVDDGSTDDSLTEIEHLTVLDSRIRCISLTRNFGQVAAISAGLDYALAPIVIIMNGNLKHPPSFIPSMLKKLKDGYEMVIATPESNINILGFQKKLLNYYYNFLDRIAPKRNENDITCFRAINHTVSDGIRQLKERNLLLENYFSWSGYKCTSLQYNCTNCSKKELKYTIQHVKQETIQAINNLAPGIFKSLFATGLIVLGASIYKIYTLIEQINKSGSVNLVSTALTLLLFGGAILLILKSRYRVHEKYQSTNSKALPKYIIKEIIEQENNTYRQYQKVV
jgi:glycosyltransferase involved in cell wall biosynthesis